MYIYESSLISYWKLVLLHMFWQWTLCRLCLVANFAHSSKEAAVSGVKSDDICVHDVLSVMPNVIRIVYINILSL